MKRAMPAMRRDALNFIKRNLGGWLIILPSLALFVFFVWLPLFSNISLSLFETKGLNKEHFVWFENYAAVFKDALFLKALWNTCKYAFWSILIGFLLPIVMAVILNEVVHLKGVFRVLDVYKRQIKDFKEGRHGLFFLQTAEKADDVLLSAFLGESLKIV